MGRKQENHHLAKNITVMIDEGRNCQWMGGGLMKNRYWHSLVVFSTKYSLITKKEMVKTGRHIVVQVIKVNTISDGGDPTSCAS